MTLKKNRKEADCKGHPKNYHPPPPPPKRES
jgi:hypothetical protein